MINPRVFLVALLAGLRLDVGGLSVCGALAAASFRPAPLPVITHVVGMMSEVGTVENSNLCKCTIYQETVRMYLQNDEALLLHLSNLTESDNLMLCLFNRFSCSRIISKLGCSENKQLLVHKAFYNPVLEN